MTLADRATRRSGTILISGVQALVRLMLVQADRDSAAGLNTAGYVSGYRGSPLGTLDTAFARAREQTEPRNILVQPAFNEEFAATATAIAGSQQIARTPGAKVDGVFARLTAPEIKAFDAYPDIVPADRAAIRHGNALRLFPQLATRRSG